ncbi:hypothetical protein AV530_017482 [Patagioenas fasciata monilis]|uniref:Uncharacterized protein n=1 Tax=Patagioenas fasciata monilis TaxID=372326 RepID=A0A1V4JGH4_PATFA|nr:hypothetical protein AV530_017482 [Patagioenas fasciata monilis]
MPFLDNTEDIGKDDRLDIKKCETLRTGSNWIWILLTLGDKVVQQEKCCIAGHILPSIVETTEMKTATAKHERCVRCHQINTISGCSCL